MTYNEEFRRKRFGTVSTNIVLNTSTLEQGDILKRFVERRNHVQKVCKAEGLAGLDQYLVEKVARPWPNMLYIDKYKLLYCSIPKEGASCSKFTII